MACRTFHNVFTGALVENARGNRGIERLAFMPGPPVQSREIEAEEFHGVHIDVPVTLPIARGCGCTRACLRGQEPFTQPAGFLSLHIELLPIDHAQSHETQQAHQRCQLERAGDPNAELPREPPHILRVIARQYGRVAQADPCQRGQPRDPNHRAPQNADLTPQTVNFFPHGATLGGAIVPDNPSQKRCFSFTLAHSSGFWLDHYLG
jgi:hypothetical protein